MEKQFTCFFTGHRDIPDFDYDRICLSVYDNIKKLCQKGYCHFITGGAIGFDTLAAKAVLKLKEEFDDISLSVYVPCLNQEKYFDDKQKKEYSDILQAADNVKILSDRYTRGCMHTRNRKMADDSSVCIAYCTKDTGGSAYTVNYAKKSGLEIIYI